MCLLKKRLCLNFIIILSVLQKNKFTSAKESHSVVYEKCGELINRFQFVLQSPGHANNNLTCEYFLKGPDNHNCHTEFHFQFLDFDLIDCSNNYLQIGDSEEDKLCGLITGVRMFKTDKKLIKLKYVNLKNQKTFFKILITKLPCYINDKLDETSVNVQPSNLSNCCANSYNSRRFFLSSPGFPNNQELSCSFRIFRANPNICRLRIHFKYFWLGLFNNNCNYGYLLIDGKRICGCQTGIDVISNFDPSWGQNPKVLEYKNIGYPNLKYNGFVLEIIQDECPTRYSPSLDTSNTNFNGSKEEKVPQFYYYNDQLNRIQFPINTTNNRDNRLGRQTSGSTFDYYFFRAPDDDEDDNNTNNYAHDIEERSYFETSNPDFNLPFDNNEYACRIWGDADFKQLSSQVLYQKMVKCGIAQTVKPNCYDVKQSQGIIISPGYPFYYPSNINLCYRIHKLENYCAVQFNVLDFDIENSQNCNKDYFLLYNKYKYCGNSLKNKLCKYLYRDVNNYYDHLTYSSRHPCSSPKKKSTLYNKKYFFKIILIYLSYSFDRFNSPIIRRVEGCDG